MFLQPRPPAGEQLIITKIEDLHQDLRMASLQEGQLKGTESTSKAAGKPYSLQTADPTSLVG
jgi:hypothetical protein